ncbi:TlpA family protein disulfide reductase [Anaerotignum sp. MB30-C6]|uniref:TlpA family protein disulfide reductase n=1 Tax=Anaerotignum sp. MB30-C6 TaxID=3070814 RepID=UPI0027DB50CE|nr:TlpA disulfide reductase family protein [Anaerotignum sp. MB30-C6]WMI80720.1 TlpA disulfide reductase family protein [Anaerotignum sp. MB30-C6]
MRKKMALFLALIMTINVLDGCGKKDTTTGNATEELQTDYRFEQCGLAYSLPKEWLQREDVNLIPVSYVDTAGEIYGKIEYDFAPSENLDELNNIDSQVPVEELMIPLFTLLVVRDENVDSDSVQDEIDLYENCEELAQEEGFHFYYLTDYIGSTPRFKKSSEKIFETLKSELPLLRETIETFPPDESSVQAQVDIDKQYLNFMSTTLDGDSITSTMFYDYDLTVVNFWASYCYPDINELDTLQAFYEELKQKYPNVNFVQVVIDTPGEGAEDIVEKAHKEAGVTFTTIIPDKNMASWIIENLNGLPTSIFVDKTGKPLPQKIEGVKDLDYYITTTDSMLKEIKTDETDK